MTTNAFVWPPWHILSTQKYMETKNSYIYILKINQSFKKNKPESNVSVTLNY